jgi:hypothetical protein
LEAEVVQAIRDQWLIVLAVVVVIGLVTWLWRAQGRKP